MGLQDNENEDKVVLKDITDDRKNEIGPLCIEESLDEEMLSDLTIEEIGFLVYALRAHHDNTTEEIFNRNIETLYSCAINKLKNSETVYVLFDQGTKMPFVFEGEVRVFSDEQFAKDVAEQYLKVHRPLDIRPFPGVNVKEQAISIFEYLYILGMDEIVLNDGRYRLDLEREELFPTPNYSVLKPEDVPVENPKLRFAMNDFFGELRWKVNYDGRQERLKEKEDTMVSELCNAIYLIPVKLDENVKPEEMTAETPIQVPKLENEAGTCFVPCFTDWIEFMKIYDMNQWVALKGDIREGLRIGNGDPVVINPHGENLIINDESRKRIEEYFATQAK